MRRNSRSGSSSRPVRTGWQTSGPVKAFAPSGPTAQAPSPAPTPTASSTSAPKRSASAARVGRTDGAPSGYELTRTVSSSGRPSSSGYRSASNDPAARARKPDAPVEGWTDPKSRDPYAQFFMQRATGTTGASGDGAVYFTTSKPVQPTVYYGATSAASTVPSGAQIDPGSRSLFRRNHAASRPSDEAPVASAPPQAGSERVDTAWAVTSRQRPASAASVRPGSAARMRADGTAPQNIGEAIAIDATALINSAAAKVASYSRPSSAATESRPQRGSSAPHAASSGSSSNMAMLGVGAGLAAALGLRNAKYTYDTPASAAPPSSRAGYDARPSAAPAPAEEAPAAAYKTPTYGSARGRAPAPSYAEAPAPAAAQIGGGRLDDMGDGDDVEAALKIASKRAASAGPSAGHTSNWMQAAAMAGYPTYSAATSQAAIGTTRAVDTVPSASSHARARSAAPSTRAAVGKTAAGESTDSAEVMGEEDSSDGGGKAVPSGGASADPRQKARSMAAHAATASSVTALSSPGGMGGGEPVASANMTEEELRQMHREREYRQRQLLKAFVASHEFDGKSNTDFYGFGKVLGQGSFGKVRLAWHRLAGAKVAIKSYEKSKLTEPNHWRRVQQEISLMEQLNHPNLIRMLETIDSPKRIHIVMEFAGGGNLCSHVKQKRRLPEPEARQIFVQLLAGLEYMHNNGVIHRDVKLENVLFSEDGDMKLLDFGFSVLCRDPNKKLKIFCGTPSYMAPEIVMRKEYLGRPVDVWSLGVLLYACLCGCFPFVAKTYPDLYKKIAQAQLTFPDYMSANAKDLIKKMLHPDPLTRITLSAVRKHPFCVGYVPPVFRAMASEMQDKALLTSEDPREDLYEAALKKAGDLGLRRQAVIDAVLSRSRCAYACVYYLIIHRYGRKRLLAASEQLAASGPDAHGKTI